MPYQSKPCLSAMFVFLITVNLVPLGEQIKTVNIGLILLVNTVSHIRLSAFQKLNYSWWEPSEPKPNFIPLV